MIDGEPPPPDAHVLLAHRRFVISPQDAADLVGVRITPATYVRLCEYSALLDVHESEQRASGGKAADRSAASEQSAMNHPEMWALYQRARMGIDG